MCDTVSPHVVVPSPAEEDKEAGSKQQREDTRELMPRRTKKEKGSLDEVSSSDSEGSVVLFDTRT